MEINPERNLLYMETMLEFSQLIAAVRSKSDLAAVVGKALKNLDGVYSYFIHALDERGDSLVPCLYDEVIFSPSEPSNRELLSRNLSPGIGLPKRVIGGESPCFIDLRKEIESGATEAFSRLYLSAGKRRQGLQKVVATVLKAGDRLLGIIWLFAERIDVSLLQAMSAQLSVAISNIRANEQLIGLKRSLESAPAADAGTNLRHSGIVGDGPAMQRVYKLISCVSQSASTVLLLGETGTGKELVARALHNSSPRKDKPMVKVNCAALPAGLIESELFGHERGAFTGAVERRVGKFELANNGTLFLDEIGEMPLETQVKLLRVLQERELERLGGKSMIKVNVRIICATNRDLEEEVSKGRFRADLFYRLNVFPIQLPPLRDRIQDIAPLAIFFLKRFAGNNGRSISVISPSVIAELEKYPWPGNVRQLEHVIERAVLLTTGSSLVEVQLPRIAPDGAVADANKSLEEIERSHIISVLRRYNGRVGGKSGAAAALQMPATTLQSKIKKHGIARFEYYGVA